MIEGRRILITGGSGTLGKALVRRMLPEGPESILVLSRGEELQHQMRNHFQDPRVRFRIGDVRDYHTVAAALDGIDVVFHAAALKQIPPCESFPREAVETNVNGTSNLVRAICDFKLPVDAVVGVSTDKACRPVNVYGMTKAIQERLFVEANLSSTTRFVTVRYGNVLVSRGSVIPLFAKQIEAGGPVTITTEDMTRFFLSIEEAVDVAMDTLSYARRGDVYVPLIGSARVFDIARLMVGDRDIEIVSTGMRPGEKVHEILLSPEETERTVSAPPGYLAVTPMLDGFPPDDRPLAIEGEFEYSSSNSFMVDEELEEYIRDVLPGGRGYALEHGQPVAIGGQR